MTARAKRGCGLAVALGFGLLYSVGLFATMGSLVTASERAGVISPFLVFLVVEVVLFAAVFGFSKLPLWDGDTLVPKIIVFSAAGFSMTYFAAVAGVMYAMLLGFGALAFAAPAVGACSLGRRL